MAILHYNTSPTSNGGIGGIHYNDCIVYGNSNSTKTVYMLAPTAGGIGDTFFKGCAFDQGPTSSVFYFNIAGTAPVFQILIESCYLVGFDTFLLYSNNSSATLKGNLTISGCHIGLIPTPFNCSNLYNAIIQGNIFKDASQKSLFSGNSKNIQIIGNQFEGDLMAGQCIQLGASVQSAIIKDNFGNFANASTFVENLTALPGTKLVVSDNLQFV
jgi:hypothetical protein